MKLALYINNYSWTVAPVQYGPALAEIAQTAEAAGFEWICVADHLWQVPHVGGPELPQLECYTTLAFLAAHTQHTRLMAMVTATPFRQPALLAKMVTTLDVISGGRAWLGIGAAHYSDEARGLGIPFPPLRERFERLDEALQICLRMWSGERGDQQPFNGAHYRLERVLNLPQSVSRPHPPILIAGNGEQKTLRLVACYADACNLAPSPDIPRKLDILREHCQAENRDYDTIEKTCVFRFDVGDNGSRVGELIGQLRWLASLGIQRVIGSVPGVERLTALEIVGRDVIPAIANL